MPLKQIPTQALLDALGESAVSYGTVNVNQTDIICNVTHDTDKTQNTFLQNLLPRTSLGSITLDTSNYQHFISVLGQ